MSAPHEHRAEAHREAAAGGGGEGPPTDARGRRLDDGQPHLERARRRDFVRHGWVHAGWLVGGAALGAGAVVLVGLFDVSARDGHWPGVPWVLHTTYERSVDFRAPDAGAVPPLDDEGLVSLGASHFDQACSQCHAAPGALQSATLHAMLPAPPHVVEAVEGWDPEHLFWILKHGVKMSGMPHWPSRTRDDDVWSVVAFLEAVGSMDGERYLELARPPLGEPPDDPEADRAADASVASIGASVDATLAGCAACHGLDGRSHANPHVPRLDLQSEAWLAATLRAYRADERHSGIMQHAASTLSDEDVGRLAAHYARAGGRARVASAGADAAPDTASDGASPDERAGLVAEGRRLATAGDARRPACASCHGPWPHPITERYPRLAGQHEAYLLTQLRLWKGGTRGGTELARMMHEVAPTLDERETRALAAFYAELDPGAAIPPAPRP